MSEAQKQGAMNIMIGMLGNIKFKTINGIQALFKGTSQGDNVLMQIMSRDGIDKYIGAYPGKINKEQVYKNLLDMQAENKLYKKLKDTGKSAAKMVDSPAAGRAARRLGVEAARPEFQFEETDQVEPVQ